MKPLGSSRSRWGNGYPRGAFSRDTLLPFLSSSHVEYAGGLNIATKGQKPPGESDMFPRGGLLHPRPFFGGAPSGFDQHWASSCSTPSETSFFYTIELLVGVPSLAIDAQVVFQLCLLFQMGGMRATSEMLIGRHYP